ASAPLVILWEMELGEPYPAAGTTRSAEDDGARLPVAAGALASAAQRAAGHNGGMGAASAAARGGLRFAAAHDAGKVSEVERESVQADLQMALARVQTLADTLEEQAAYTSRLSTRLEQLERQLSALALVEQRLEKLESREVSQTGGEGNTCRLKE
ncbi:hypothetical protein CYMTET_40660, partial [Cymbomonas tetramitiformis]